MSIKNYKTPTLNLPIITRIELLLFYSLILLLPTQLGKHFWPDFSYVLGIRIDYLSPTIFLTDIIVAGLFVFWFLRTLRLRMELKSKVKNQKSKNQFKIQRYYLIFILAILYLIFNILISGRIIGGQYSLLKFFEMSFIAYYTAKFIDQKKHLPKVTLLFCAGVVFESLLAIAQFILHRSVGGIFYFFGERTFYGSTPGIANASLSGELVLRPYGTFPHPNVLAGFLVVSMTLILFSLQHSKNKKELRVKKQELWFVKKIITPLIHDSYFLIQLSALVLGTIILFPSMSRIAILLWVFILVYFFIKIFLRHPGKQSASRISNVGDSRQARMTKSALFILIVGIIAISILSPFGSRFTNISKTDEAIVQREVLINSSIKMLTRAPLFGVGLGNFIPSLLKIQKPLSLGLYLQPVHNIFLLVLAETGLIGLGFFIWMIWNTFQRISSQSSEIRTSLTIALSAILILGLFDHYWLTLQQGQLLFAFLIGLCWVKTKNT